MAVYYALDAYRYYYNLPPVKNATNLCYNTFGQRNIAEPSNVKIEF